MPRASPRSRMQIAGAISPGTRLDNTRKQKEDAAHKLNANLNHLKLAQENCHRAILNVTEAEQYNNKVKEETPGTGIASPPPQTDAGVASALFCLLSFVCCD